MADDKTKLIVPDVTGTLRESSRADEFGAAYPIHARIAPANYVPEYIPDYKLAVRFGEYEVEGGPYYGGLGRVYKVRHLPSGALLAMKQPLPGKYLSIDGKEQFARERAVVATFHAR
jgi:hypothetical protein